MASGVQLSGSHVQYNQGTLKQTNNDFDMALQGDGFFTIEGPNGQHVYTRNGSFNRAGDGTLITQDGMRVLSDKGKPIIIPPETPEMTVTSTGLVANGDNIIGQLGIAEFENVDSLEQQGQYLFTATPTTRKDNFAEGKTSVVQGSLEMANVNAVEELVRNISGTRRYEAMQKSIQTQNESLRLAVNQVGRYR